MGAERAETYLRLRAEAELRRAGAELRRLDAAAGAAQADPGMTPFSTAETAGWKVVRAGRILVAAGVLDQDYLDRFASDLHATIQLRSRLHAGLVLVAQGQQRELARGDGRRAARAR